MRAVADGRVGASSEVRHHLDLCLDCRACESACPSGVKYGQIIEPFKVALHASAPPDDRTGILQRLILHHLFPYAARVKVALGPARFLQKFGALDLAEKVGLTRLLPPTLRRLQAMLPTLTGAGSRLPTVLPPVGPKRARVALFLGCVADAMFPETNAATARVLQANGCEVIVPRNQGCCGAIHYHSGSEAPALGLARKNLATFDPDRFRRHHRQRRRLRGDAQGLRPPPAGSGDEAAARKFVAKVRDISEFLVELGPIAPKHPAAAQGHLSRPLPPLPRPAGPRRATATARADPRPGTGPARGERALLRGRRDLQPHATRDVRAAQQVARWTGSSRDRGEGRRHRQCRLHPPDRPSRSSRPAAPSKVVHPVDLLDLAYRGPNASKGPK